MARALAAALAALAASAPLAEANRARMSHREQTIRIRSERAVAAKQAGVDVDKAPHPFKPGTGKSTPVEGSPKRRGLAETPSSGTPADWGLKSTKCFKEPLLEAEFLGLFHAADPVACLPGVLPDYNEAECQASHEIFASEPSCCMADACLLPCPVPTPDPHDGFMGVIVAFMVVFCLIGIGTVFLIRDKSVNFFVAGRSLPLWVIVMTLASQSIDSNALLGNADLSHYYNFWDGAVLPIGLGLSLILNGVFLAHKINEENVMTLPDVYAQRYGSAAELAASVCLIASFLMLLAGNLVGMGVILEYLSPDINDDQGVWVAAIITLIYTACGGLFSVAYTDCVQSVIGWTGCLACALYLCNKYREGDMQISVQPTSTNGAPPPSIGFALSNDEDPVPMLGYVYPDGKGDGGVCDMYNGTDCVNVPGACCYNREAHYDVEPDKQRVDNGAYPIGDEHPFPDYMTDPHAYFPFPNAIMFNWATIFVLGFGNLAALDFQARCMAAKTPNVARIGCIIAGFLTFFVGIPWAYVGGITRYFYGPDSIHAEFEPDSCNRLLLLPTCGLWVPDKMATVKLLTHEAPQFLGGWALVGMVAASMSTSDGAILAMGTVLSHNIFRHLMPKESLTDAKLLTVARGATVPFAIIGAIIAAYVEIDHASGTGYLLIVAFDIAFASCVVALFAAFYVKDPSPTAAFMSIVVGALTRLILEFALPKDGTLIYPWGGLDFLDLAGHGGVNSYVPGFTDQPDFLLWNGTGVDESNWPGNPDEAPFGVGPGGESTCNAEPYEDYTGVDSLIAPGVSLFVFIVFHLADKMGGIAFPASMGMTPYKKFDEEGNAVDAPPAEEPKA